LGPKYYCSEIEQTDNVVPAGKEPDDNTRRFGTFMTADQDKQGFTLMELVVTVAIISILLAITVPSILSTLRSYHLQSAVAAVTAPSPPPDINGDGRMPFFDHLHSEPNDVPGGERAFGWRSARYLRYHFFQPRQPRFVVRHRRCDCQPDDYIAIRAEWHSPGHDGDLGIYVDQWNDYGNDHDIGGGQC